MNYEIIYTTNKELCGKIEVSKEKCVVYTCDEQVKIDTIQLQKLLENSDECHA